MKGYDLGGAECPMVDEDGVEWTVVDVQDPDWSVTERPPGPFILQDLRKDFSYLEPVPRVWIGGMLRYLTHPFGWQPGDLPGYKEQIRFEERLHEILEPGGKVTIRDYLEVVSFLIAELCVRGYTITKVELIEPPWDGRPADWIIELQKPL